MTTRQRIAAVLAACGAAASMTATSGGAQAGRTFTTNFTVKEFADRRAKIYDAIGPDSVALMQGLPSVHSSAIFRQSNEFYYVSGVVVPQALLLMDGATRRSILYLPKQNVSRAAVEGDLLSSDDPAKTAATTGVDEVKSPDQLAADLQARGVKLERLPLQPQAFEAAAQRRVALGLIIAELARAEKLQPKPAEVRALIEQEAASYESPAEVVKWFYMQPQRLSEMEGLALEGNVVNWVLAQAKAVDKAMPLADATLQQEIAFFRSELLLELGRLDDERERARAERRTASRPQQGVAPLFFGRIADFGRNAFTTSSLVSMYGPPIRSMQ